MSAKASGPPPVQRDRGIAPLAHIRRESQNESSLSKSASGISSQPLSPLSASYSPRYSSSSTSSFQRFGPSASLPSRGDSSIDRGRTNVAATTGLLAQFDDDEDDELHTFTDLEKHTLSTPTDFSSWRGWTNGLMLFVLLAAIVILFGGYPVIEYYNNAHKSFGTNTEGYNLGGVNGSGQYPAIGNLPTLVDKDTPADALTHKGDDGKTWNLVFSDEFNVDGRTFFDGDDPFFQAIDLHYWGTNDLEYYDPSAATTKDGHLVLTMNQEPIHGLQFKSGMIQSWNKLCFNRNAYVEVSISLPGTSAIGGFWPGAWLFGNLGRPGYGATTDGTWPYSYDTCDVGTLPNQTWVNGSGPDAALTTGGDGGTLSYLPGQRWSACTCKGEDHPGPSHDVGRGVPEIDIIEAQILIEEAHGQVSQTFQVAPYDDSWIFDNSSGKVEVYDRDVTALNSYYGGVYQQSCSSLSTISDDIYLDQKPTGGNFKKFGVEYVSNEKNRGEAYILWTSQGKKAWKMFGTSIGPNDKTEVGQRVIPEEPMTLVFNFGMSNNFQTVDFDHLTFPNYMRIDYVRVYQNDDGTVGCDPDDRPTADYIKKFSNAYNNPNLTTWDQAGHTVPKNRLLDQC